MKKDQTWQNLGEPRLRGPLVSYNRPKSIYENRKNLNIYSSISSVARPEVTYTQF